MTDLGSSLTQVTCRDHRARSLGGACVQLIPCSLSPDGALEVDQESQDRFPEMVASCLQRTFQGETWGRHQGRYI